MNKIKNGLLALKHPPGPIHCGSGEPLPDPALHMEGRAPRAWGGRALELGGTLQDCCPHRPDHHFLEAICCFPMVYYMEGSVDK